jgi:hypothetical protein
LNIFLFKVTFDEIPYLVHNKKIEMTKNWK